MAMAMAFGVGILIEGADRIELPSYSIMAGLGVGGLAVDLAGQQALSNLLGSLIIMFEKPFRIGHTIKTGGFEGTIENIGFRTAKIRTSDGILLIAPSSELIRHPIENMTMRDSWRIKKTLYYSAENQRSAAQRQDRDDFYAPPEGPGPGGSPSVSCKVLWVPVESSLSHVKRPCCR